MARRRPSHQPQVTLSHPNDPSITVTVQKPTRIQGIELGQILAKGMRALEVEGKDGKPAVDASGEPRVFVQHVVSLDAITAGLKNSIVNWSGIEDDKGPIPFSPDRVSFLLEEFLDVKDAIDEPIPEEDQLPDGPKTRKVSGAFSRWINDQISDPKTWSSDPKENASAKL